MIREEGMRRIMELSGLTTKEVNRRLSVLRQSLGAEMDLAVTPQEEEDLEKFLVRLRDTPDHRQQILRMAAQNPAVARSIMNNAARELRARVVQAPHIESVPARDYFFRVGQRVWEATYAKKPDASPQEVIDLAVKHFVRLYQHDPDMLERTELFLSTEEGQSLYMEAAAWVNCAMPVVQLAGHKYAAALAATAVPRGIEIRPPWDAFLLELPTGFFSTCANGKTSPLTHVLAYVVDKKYTVSKAHDLWYFHVFSPDMVNLRKWNYSLKSLVDESSAYDEDGIEPAFTDELSDQDERTLSLVTRIVLNTCLVMSDPDEIRPIGKNHGGSRSPKRDKDGPLCRMYRVGTPVELDVRPALQEYLSGKRRGSSPTVQYLRRGHFTHQPYGPGNSLRRVQWRKPCWVGPEDALINVRPHVMPTTDAPPVGMES